MDENKGYSIKEIRDAIYAAFREKSRVSIGRYSGLRKNILELDDLDIGPFVDAVLQELTKETNKDE